MRGESEEATTTKAICTIHPGNEIQNPSAQTGIRVPYVLTNPTNKSRYVAVGAAPEFEAATDPDLDVVLGE